MYCKKMSEWLRNQSKLISNISQYMQERIENANPCRERSAEESKGLNKLEGIAGKFKRGANAQNCKQVQGKFLTSTYR